MGILWNVIYILGFALLLYLFYFGIGKFPPMLPKSSKPGKDILLALILWGLAVVTSALMTTVIIPAVKQIISSRVLQEAVIIPILVIPYLVVPYYLVIKPKQWSGRDLGLTKKVQSREVVVLALLLGLFTGSIAFLNNQAVIGIEPLPWGVLFLLVFTNSFVEEFYHRGVIQSLIERAINQKYAVLIGGILFGLTHIVFDIVKIFGTGGIWAVLSALLLQTMGGWLVGTIYLKTRSLFPGMIFHYLVNWLPSILMNLAG